MMANFVKLTDDCDKKPIWVNMDRVEAFWQSKSGHTVLTYAEVDQNEMTPNRTVVEPPEKIADALIEARQNNGYGFDGDR